MRFKLYEQIVGDVEQMIRSGELATGDPLLTEVEMAAKYNVSRSTVRQALNQLQDRGMITREVGRGTFVRPPAPDWVYVAVYGKFAWLFDPDDLYFRVWRAVAERMNDHGIDVHAVALDRRRPLKEALLANDTRGARGVMLITYHPIERSDIAAVAQSGMPCVLINRYLHAPGVYGVTLDDFGGTRAGVHYLNQRGHHRIAIANWKLRPRTTFDDRIAGYRHAMVELGLESQLQEFDVLLDDEASVKSVIRQAVSDGATAMLTVSGKQCIAMKRIAEGMGLRIPDDLSFLGFGDTLQVTREEPPITHVDYRAESMGHMGADVMRALVEGDLDQPKRQILPTSIVEGGTVATLK